MAINYDEIIRGLKAEKRSPNKIDYEGLFSGLKQGEEEGLLDFLGRNIKIGTASMIENASKIVENGMRPESLTPSQWEKAYKLHDKHKAIEEWANEVVAENQRQYNPDTEPLKYYGGAILQSAPESIATMLAAAAAGSRLGGIVGAGANGLRSFLTSALGKNIYNAISQAYNGKSTAAKIARQITPNAKTVATTGVGSHLEALSEGQRAKDEYIEDAKRKGSYEKDVTELEAEKIGNKVYRDNIGIITGANAAEYNMMFGRHGGGLKNRLGRLIASMGMEGGEEAAQEYATMSELGKPIDERRIKDAAITGAAMGGIMNVAGQAATYPGERREAREQAERNIKYRKLYNDLITKTDEEMFTNALKFEQAKPSRSLRNWTNRITDGKMSDEVHDLIVKAAEENGVDRKLALSLAMAESKGNQNEVSEAGAIGVMQLMPETARSLGVNPYDVEQNIEGGIRYLKQQLDAVGGDWRKAAAAYNAGLGAVQKYGGIPPYGETQAYVKRIGEYLNESPDEEGGQRQKQDIDLNAIAKPYIGQRMPNGELGCVDAVVRIGSGYNDFLKDQYDKNIAYVPTLIENAQKAGVEVIPFDANRLEKGDVIVYDGRETDQHVMIYDGNGGVVGNSTSRQQVVTQNSYDYAPKQLKPSRIIKTGVGNNINVDDRQTSKQESNKNGMEKQQQLDPLFEIAGNDKATVDMLQSFMDVWKNTSTGEEATKAANLFDKVTDRQGKLIDTAENRQMLVENYGEEIKAYEKETILKLADELIAKKRDAGDFSYQEVESAKQAGDIEAIKKILKENKVKVPKIEAKTPNLDNAKKQQRANTVEGIMKNEQFLSKGLLRAMEVAQEEVSDKASRRVVQGKAQMVVAKELGINLDEALKNALYEGKTKAITKAQEQLKKIGAFELNRSEALDYARINREEEAKRAREKEYADEQEAILNREIGKETQNRKAIVNILNGYKKKKEAGAELQRTRRITGKEAEVETDNGTNIKTRYQVLEADEIVSSDNELYPQELQPRDRDREFMREQTRGMSNNLKAVKVMESNNVNEGAPVVRDDGVVLNGNGRVMGIRGAYELGKAEHYKQALMENADRLGIDKTAIEKMKQPILVRAVTHSLNDREKKEVIESTTGGARMGASEQAKIDAGKLTAGALSRYMENENGDYTTAANREFVSEIIGKIVGKNEVNAYTDKRGEINADGINRVKRAVFAKAYEDDGLISKMAESTDDNIRNVSNGLMNAAAKMASIQIQMDEGSLHKYDIAKNISGAVKRLSALREQGIPVDEYMKQQSMFDEYADTEEMREILSFIEKNKRSARKISSFLNEIADKIKAQGDPKQTSLFEGIKPLEQLEIIKKARKKIEDFEEQQKRNAEAVKVLEVAENAEKEAEKFVTLPKGYRTESGKPLSECEPKEFIVEENGKKDFGYINDKVVEVANNKLEEIKSDFRLKAAPVRLQVGIKKGREGFGYVHLMDHIEDIQAKGFDDALSYIQHVLKNYDQIYKAAEEENRIILYCKGNQSKGLMPLDLELDKGNDEYYTIVTAYPRRKISKNEKEKLIFDESPTHSSTAAVGDVQLEESNDKDGVEPQRDIAKINSSDKNITQKEEKNNNEDNETAFEVDENYEQPEEVTKQKLFDIGSTTKGYPIAKLNESLSQEIIDKINDLVESYGGTKQEVGRYKFKFPEDRDSFVLDVIDLIKTEKLKAGKAKAKANAAKWTDSKLDEVVANNPDLVESVKQLGGFIFDGHVRFKNKKDRKNFIKHLENLENKDLKLSIEGKGKATVENFVDPKDLTEQQRGIAEIGDEMGVPVVYFKGSEELNGAHANGITYINVDSKVDPRWIFWHEAGHWLKAQHPELIGDIIDNLGISHEQVDDFRERTKRYDLTDNETREEIFADNMFDADKRLDIMQRLGKKDAGLLDRLVSWLKSIMDKVTSFFNIPKYGLTNTQKNQMFAELGKALRQIKENGKPRYRYGNTTHVVQYADGRELPAAYSFAGVKALTANQKSLAQAQRMEKSGKSRDEIFNETGWVKGRDNKWRFEIPDNLDKIDFEALSAAIEEDPDNGVTLDEIYDNPQLYKAYPQLKDITVFVDDLSELSAGAEVDSNGDIIIDEAWFSNAPEDIKSFLVHEIQHAIQRYEGFAEGGNPEAVRMQLKDNVGNIVREIQKINGGEDYFHYAIGIQRAKNEGNESKQKSYEESVATLKKRVKFKDKDINRMDKLAEKFVELQEGYLSNEYKVELYERLGGEQEAREVQRRAGSKQIKEKVINLENKIYTATQKLKKLKENLPKDIQNNIDKYFDSDPDDWVYKGDLSMSFPKKIRDIITEIENAESDLYWADGSIEVPTIHDEDALIVFGGKKYAMASAKEPLDIRKRISDNVSEKVFDKYLNDGIKQMVEETVSNEIGEHVDISKMSDPVARDETRDKLPYIHKMLTWYNQLKGKPSYQDHFAARIEYARRCFDNDSRIRNAAVRETNGNEGQSRKYQDSSKTVSRNDSARDNKDSGRITRGVSRHISGEKDGAYKHFLSLYDEIENKEKHSKQGAFSNAKYSIGSNEDNSNESYWEKAKKYFTKRNEMNERQKKKMTRLLMELSGYKIGYAHTDKDLEVKEAEKVIRTRKAYDFERILPVVGKLTAQQLNLEATPEMSNYIADWILTGVVSNRSAEAQAFEKAMRDNPEIGDKLLAIRESMQDELNMTPLQLTKSAIKSEETKKSFAQIVGVAKKKFDKEWRDDLSPIKRLVEDIEKTTGQKVPDNINAYLESRMYKGTDDVVYRNMIEAGSKEIENAVAALQARFPTVDFTGFKPLAAIIEEAGGHKALEDFAAYVTNKHIKDIHEHNRKNPDKYMETRLSEATCDAVIEQFKNKFDQAQKDLVRFSKVQLEMLYRSGLLSEKNYNEMKNKWPNYVPLHRVFDENEDLNTADSMKRMKGSRRDIFNPIQEIHKNTFDFVRRAEKNRIKCLLANLSRCGGVGTFIEEVDKKRPDVHKTITFYENGKKKYLEIADEDVVQAINSIDNRIDGMWIMKMIRAATGIVRSLMTALNVDFAAGNIFRDAPDAYINNKYGKKNPITMFCYIYKGLMSAIHKDKVFYEWLAFGGGQATFVSEDRDRLKTSLDEISKTSTERWFKSGVNGFFSQVLNTMQLMSEYSEYATRIGVYQMTKDTLAQQNSDKQATWADKRKAAYISRDATIDFARAGRSAREANRYFAFSNAAIQGIDRFCRTFDWKKLKTEQGKNELAGAIFRMAVVSIIPTIACFLLNHDKDWYKNLPEWQKDNNWILGEGIKIPKGMDLGLRLSSNLTEHFLSWALDNKPFEFFRAMKPLKDSLPYISTYGAPTLLTPIAELASNYSFFREAPIVPLRMQKLPAHMQRDAYSSWLAKHISDVTGFSPKNIDHFISSYFGFMGRLFSGGVDMTLETAPMTRRFIFDPYKNPQNVKEYYEKYKKQSELYEEYKVTKKKPDDFDPTLFAKFKAAKKTMSALSKLENTIINDTKLDIDERRKKLRKLEEKRMAFVDKVLKGR